ncbi:MAG: hypothetical protein KatS3mg008_1882 [Acidimicrobiales bacterium]|nr:MAG: hypothetical protein KatS3mg008_1882 [Acidimicrobiales bacterium]
MTHISSAAGRLFALHTPEELGGWLRRLRHFRYVRSAGSPMPGDPEEELVVSVAWGDRETLLGVMEALGVADRIPPSPPADLGWRRVAGGKAIARIVLFPGRLEIVVGGAPARRPRLVETDIEAAEAIEEVLVGLELTFVDPPRQGPWVLSPLSWPGLWEMVVGDVTRP